MTALAWALVAVAVLAAGTSVGLGIKARRHSRRAVALANEALRLAEAARQARSAYRFQSADIQELHRRYP